MISESTAEAALLFGYSHPLVTFSDWKCIDFNGFEFFLHHTSTRMHQMSLDDAVNLHNTLSATYGLKIQPFPWHLSAVVAN